MLPVANQTVIMPAIFSGTFDIAQNLPYLDMVEQYQSDKLVLVRNYVALRRFYRQKITFQRHLLATGGVMPAIATLKTAAKRLDIQYWEDLIGQSRLSNIMSADSKQQWEESLKDASVPEFTLENVVGTMKHIYASIPHYLKERILKSFSGLSNSHVTNSGFGFGSKMIIEGAFPAITPLIKRPSPLHSKVDVLDEIRKLVIFFSTSNPSALEKHEQISSYGFMEYAIAELDRSGKSSFHLDNDLIFVRVYKKGTVHFGIHPDIVEKINTFLASLMGLSLGNSVRTKAKYFYTPRPQSSYQREYVSPQSINALSNLMSWDRDTLKRNDTATLLSDFDSVKYAIVNKWENTPDNVKAEAKHVLQTLGFKLIDGQTASIGHFSFILGHNLNKNQLNSLLQKVLNEGLDSKVSYQQYYTSKSFSEVVFDAFMTDRTSADLQTMEFLEPSAGLGGLSSLLPANKTTVVDISAINCEILKTHGYKEVVCDDFLLYAKRCAKRFDGILMNPPFVDMQAYGHVMTASNLLAHNGTLVAVVPCSLRASFSKGVNNGDFFVEMSRTYEKAFDDANVGVFLITLTRK